MTNDEFTMQQNTDGDREQYECRSIRSGSTEVDPCLASLGSIAMPSDSAQVAVFLRRQHGKIEGKTDCAGRDELSDGWLRESDFPVRDGLGAGATAGRGPEARRDRKSVV